MIIYGRFLERLCKQLQRSGSENESKENNISSRVLTGNLEFYPFYVSNQNVHGPEN
jgi:hypothetical protein